MFRSDDSNEMKSDRCAGRQTSDRVLPRPYTAGVAETGGGGASPEARCLPLSESEEK